MNEINGFAVSCMIIQPANMILLITFFISEFTLQFCSGARTTVSLTAPVNPVSKGAMLALHCQIWDYSFQDESEVLFSRIKDGKTKRLSWNEEIVGDEESIYLAVRQLSDTSLVYFMSITDVVKETGAEYECKVIDASTLATIAKGSVNVTVNYFPSDPNPECYAVNNKMTLRSGEYLSLNCSAKDGLPPVDITWTQSRDNNKLKVDTHRESGVVFGISTFKVSYHRHNQAVFLCTITSLEFPNDESRCHIGPITVIGTPDEIKATPTKSSNLIGKTVTTPKTISNNIPNRGVSSTECVDVCSSLNGPVRFWIIATVVGGIFAVVFCLFGVCLACKIRMDSKNLARSPKYIMPRAPMDDVYESLDRRCIDAKVYMAIEKLEKNGNQIIYPTEMEEAHNYNTAPRASKFK